MSNTQEFSQAPYPEAIAVGSILYIGSYYRKGVYHAMPVLWGNVQGNKLDANIDVREEGQMGRGYYMILDKVQYKGDSYFFCQKVDFREGEVEVIGGYFLLKIHTGRKYHILNLEEDELEDVSV